MFHRNPPTVSHLTTRRVVSALASVALLGVGVIAAPRPAAADCSAIGDDGDVLSPADEVCSAITGGGGDPAPPVQPDGDGDGTPNDLEPILDANDDGKTDDVRFIVHSIFKALNFGPDDDTDGDAIPNVAESIFDADDDGMVDAGTEWDDNAANAPRRIVDANGDEKTDDFRVIVHNIFKALNLGRAGDADRDGIPDVAEAILDADGDGTVDPLGQWAANASLALAEGGADADGDSIPDRLDAELPDEGWQADSDVDGIPDPLDEPIPDEPQAWDADLDGIPDALEPILDADDDGEMDPPDAIARNLAALITGLIGGDECTLATSQGDAPFAMPLDEEGCVTARGVVAKAGPLAPTTTTSTTTTTTVPPTTTTTPTAPPPNPAPPERSSHGAPKSASTPSEQGYWVLGPDGQVYAFGDAEPIATAVSGRTSARLVDLASDGTRGGIWLLDQVGGIHARGGAPFFGSIPGRRNAGMNIGQADAVAIAATPDGGGHLVLDQVGGIHAFGDADFLGSMPGRLGRAHNSTVRYVDVAMTPTGNGYVILDEVGGVHAFGDAQYFGSIPSRASQNPSLGAARYVAIAMAPGGAGYWILDDVGGVHAFGSAGYHGSVPMLRQQGLKVGDARAADLEAKSDGSGYWVFDVEGGAFAFGQAAYAGSVPAARTRNP